MAVKSQEQLNEVYEYLEVGTIRTGTSNDKIEEIASKYQELKDKFDALQEDYNNQNAEYTNFKATIAEAITEKGIETSEEADANTMASNIRQIENDVEAKLIYSYTTKGSASNISYKTTKDYAVIIAFVFGCNEEDLTVGYSLDSRFTKTNSMSFTELTRKGGCITGYAFNISKDTTLTFYAGYNRVVYLYGIN